MRRNLDLTNYADPDTAPTKPWRIRMRRIALASLMVCGAALIGAQVQAQAPAAAPAGRRPRVARQTAFRSTFPTARRSTSKPPETDRRGRGGGGETSLEVRDRRCRYQRRSRPLFPDGRRADWIDASPKAKPALRRASAARHAPSTTPSRPAIHTSATLDPTIVASPGGFPLFEGGKLIGAIGCSGGTGDQDAAACKVGADLVK